MGKIKIIKLYWWVLLVLPVMDSLNGWLNNGGNEGGLSLGIIYRLIVVLLSLYLIMKNGLKQKRMLYCLVLLSYFALSALINRSDEGTYIMLLFKLLLPIMLICTIESCACKESLDLNFVISLFELWTWIFPLSIIVPYFLHIGFSTYGGEAVGYKGFYYAQNDIGYILSLLYLYMIYEIEKGITIKKVITILLLLGSNLLLGLKSNYMLVAASTVFYVIRPNKKHNGKIAKAFVMLLIGFGIGAICTIYADDIRRIIERWKYFYNERTILSFLSSSRWDRVAPAFTWFFENMKMKGILIGSGLSYVKYTVIGGVSLIEMDLFDLFFQLGMGGVILIYGFYINIQRIYCSKFFYLWGFMLSIICSILMGHIIESALSGMVFAVLCSGAVLKKHDENRRL